MQDPNSFKTIQSMDYFYQKPHHNWFNKFFYSNFMKKYNPLHEPRSYHPLYHVRLANWYGVPPHATWVDGIIDYTYDKYNTTTVGHFHMHENRKNKPFKQTNGGDKNYLRDQMLHPTYVKILLPKGCAKEIKLYKDCVVKKGDVNRCTEQKINIMEVCPKWSLELLRERKKFIMRATLIDNETYRRAMKVSAYNQARSLRDIKEDTKGQPDIRTESYWYDDRYNPTKYPGADQNTNVVLGDVTYSDPLGGNKIQKIMDQREKFMKNSYESLKNMAKKDDE
jgi:hypothetical protein